MTRAMPLGALSKTVISIAILMDLAQSYRFFSINTAAIAPAPEFASNI